MIFMGTLEMQEREDLSRNYKWDGWEEEFPYQPLWLPWPEETEEIKESTSGIINWDQGSSPLDKALYLVKRSFWKQVPDTSITEVSDLLPEELDIQIWHLDQWKWYTNRTLRVNWFLYEAREEVEIGWWVVIHIKPIFEDSESFELPDEIQYADSADDTIKTLQSWVMMKNSKVWSIRRIRVSDFQDLRSWVERIFLDLNELATWQTAESISNNWNLRRNYGFMTWYIRNYNKSLETSSQS